MENERGYRPNTITTEGLPEVIDALVAAARKGIPVSAAAKAIGIAQSTLSLWLRISRIGRSYASNIDISVERIEALRPLSPRLDQAYAEWEAEQITNIVNASAELSPNGARNWKASAWLLNNHPTTRQTYRPEKNYVIERLEASPEYQAVVRLSDAQLEALAFAEDSQKKLQAGADEP